MKTTFSKLIFVAGFALALAFTTSCGPSAAQQAILAMPSVEDVSGLKDKLFWLKNNAQSGGNYVLEVNANEEIGEMFSFPEVLSYKDKSDITITLKGVGGNRTISRRSNPYPGSVFIVQSGVTLILDDNITLRGIKIVNPGIANHTSSVVSVRSGGTLVMNDGATITGNSYHNVILRGGGGVSVSGGGTFIMKGGIIYGNECFIFQNDPQLAMMLRNDANSKALASAVISKTGGSTDAIGTKNYTHYTPKGCGVYVEGKTEGGRSLFIKPGPAGDFIKTGGTITGYGSDQENGNVVKELDGQGIAQNQGHAVYVGGKSIDITIGPEVQLSFKNGVFSGDWDGGK